MVCVAHIDAEAIPIKCLSDNLPSVLFTFITNAVILRYITSDVLGIISVRYAPFTFFHKYLCNVLLPVN